MSHQEARRAEAACCWEEAAKLWRSMGEWAHAAACVGIIEATERGDRFRARYAELKDEALRKAYNEVYHNEDVPVTRHDS